MCGEEELCDGGLVEGFEEGGYWMGMEGGGGGGVVLHMYIEKGRADCRGKLVGGLVYLGWK